MNGFLYYKRNELYTFLIDKKGSISGSAMKDMKDRTPWTFDKLKEKLSELEPKIGSCFQIDFCLFIVCKEHYRNKVNQTTFNKIIEVIAPKLKEQGKSLKIYAPDYNELNFNGLDIKAETIYE